MEITETMLFYDEKKSEDFVYVPVISKTLEHIETFNTNYQDFS